jgi:thiosulfate/3-mercaptopyruvate sulfurtransferase
MTILAAFVLLLFFPQGKTPPKWEPAELIQPQELVVRVRDTGPSRPLIISVGFPGPYRDGHIPATIFAGPASTDAGRELLKRALEKVPKNRDIVIYCGCCPWEACPNTRPAVDLLHSMGYTRVQALMIASNLEADWLNKGYPLEKGDPR